MNVLITGIDGFVGSHLADTLAAMPGVHLVGTIRDPVPLPNISHLASRLTLVRADITERTQVEEALRKARPERIYHLAGQAFVPLSLKNPLETWNTNVVGTLNLLESVREIAAKEGRSPSVLVVSSGEVYGFPDSSGKAFAEDSPLNPANPYAASKACIDLIAQQYRRSFGLDVVVVRPFNHLGPRQSDSFVGSSFARQIAEIKLGLRSPKIMVGNLDPERDFTDVRDVVRAYLLLLDRRPREPVYNVCSGTGVAIRHVLDRLRDLAGVAVEVVPDPGRVRSNDTPRIVGSADRMYRETGWRPEIPLDRTLRDLLAYWEERLRAGQ